MLLAVLRCSCVRTPGFRLIMCSAMVSSAGPPSSIDVPNGPSGVDGAAASRRVVSASGNTKGESVVAAGGPGPEAAGLAGAASHGPEDPAPTSRHRPGCGAG